MHTWKLLSLMFCVLRAVCANQAIGSDARLDLVKSDEETSSLGSQSSSSIDAGERNQSEPEGPPDSHEAMNNRDLKTKATSASRRKRSYEFLMGLVKRNATLYPITKQDHESEPIVQSLASETRSSELLLELLVKIAEKPKQWMRVHELLQTLDADLMKSKQLVDNAREQLINEDHDMTPTKYPSFPSASRAGDAAETPKTSPSARPNQFASAYQNFAYHRVTGNPLAYAGSKSPKAYIAVSVIAPKPIPERVSQANSEAAPDTAPDGLTDEVALENELQELKEPWTHHQNLQNMAAMRSRWIIQNDHNSLYER